MIKPRIAFLVDSPIFKRNYIDSGAIDSIEQKAHLTFLLRNDVSVDFLDRFGPDVRLIKYGQNNLRNLLHFTLLDFLMFKNAHKSISFRYRIFRVFGLSREIKTISNVRFKARVKGFFINLARYIPGVLQGAKFILSFNNPFEKIFINNSFDLIICPSSAYDPGVIDCISQSRKKGIKSLLLVDNWDNASSKSIFWEMPDAVCCWGKQSEKHFSEIQNYSGKKFSIGTPRFDVYIKKSDELFSSGGYLLFLGTALSFDELAVLVLLDRLLVEGKLPKSIKKIIYRPHPWRHSESLPEIQCLSSVVLDPQLAKLDWSKSSVQRGLPDLQYYPKLLKESELIVGGYTSMLIEGLLCEKPVIGLSHIEEFNPTSPHLVASNYEHFKGLDAIEGFFDCSSLSSIEEIIKQASSFQFNAKLNFPLREIIYSDEVPYAERLERVVFNNILGEVYG